MDAEALGTQDEALDVGKEENNNTDRRDDWFGHHRMAAYYGQVKIVQKGFHAGLI